MQHLRLDQHLDRALDAVARLERMRERTVFAPDQRAFVAALDHALDRLPDALREIYEFSVAGRE